MRPVRWRRWTPSNALTQRNHGSEEKATDEAGNEAGRPRSTTYRDSNPQRGGRKNSLPPLGAFLINSLPIVTMPRPVETGLVRVGSEVPVLADARSPASRPAN